MEQVERERDWMERLKKDKMHMLLERRRLREALG